MDQSIYTSTLDLLRCRDYQRKAVVSAFETWQLSKSGIIILPTGMGKTHVGGAICRIWEQYREGRILWIAHRKELIEQAASRIELLTGEAPEIEMGDSRATPYSLMAKSGVVVASIQSLMAGRKCNYCDGTGGVLEHCDKCDGKGCDAECCEQRGTRATDIDCPFCLGGRVRRLQKFKPTEFGLIVTDEAHHCLSETYRRVFKWFRKVDHTRFLGLTATPDRGDEQALGQVFQSVIANIDLLTAISNGWLVPISQKSITCDHVDFSNIRTTAGDLNQGDLEKVLMLEEALHEMVIPTIEMAEDRRTLVFCVDKAHTRKVAELINRYRQGAAQYVLGDTPTKMRSAIFDDHKSGKFQFLVNCGVTTEGYDDPGIQVVAIMRPTKSRALFTQMVGRGTRPVDPPMQDTPEARRDAIAASIKPNMLVLDYVGNCGRHKLISTIDLFGGEYSAEVLDRAKRISQEEMEELPTEELIRRAQEQLTAEEERRKEQEEAKRLAFLKAKEAKYKAEEISPFSWWDTLPQTISAKVRTDTATEDQVKALVKFGVEPRKMDDLSAAEARVMLKHLNDRRKKGLCTYKQSKLLQKYGIKDDLTFAAARAVIDSLAANNWRMTPTVKSVVEKHLQGAGT